MNPRRYFHENRVAGLFLRWIVPGAVILLAVAVSGDSVGSEPTTSTGVQVTKSVPFVRESIDDIRALAPCGHGRSPETGSSPFIEFQGDPMPQDMRGSRRRGQPLRPPSLPRLPPPRRRCSTAASRAWEIPLPART